jgi:alpha-galactosidase
MTTVSNPPVGHLTRNDVSRMLMHMEHLRMSADEADTEREEREMMREYRRLWKAVEPYLSTPPLLAYREEA